MQWDHAHVRQSVTLKLPRRVMLQINDIAGRVNVGQIDGDVRINDVAGSLDVALVNGAPHINDIAGSVRVGVGELGSPLPCNQGRDPSCPGIGNALRVVTKRVQWEKRRCVMVKVPAKGEIELTANAPDLLDLLTGTMVALPNTPEDRPNVRVTVAADDRRPDVQLLTADGAIHLHHPKAREQLRFTFEQLGDAAKPGEPAEVCLQLTAWVEN
jgi:hypothetical protein